MINFRFHLASLIAIFLALAVGVVMGSTVVNTAIVDGLRDQINTVKGNVNEQRAANNELRFERDRLQDYANDTAPFAVTGRLPDTPVAIVAVRGIDDDTVQAAVELAQQSGATAPAVLWIEPAWTLGQGKDEDAQKLPTALGIQTAGDRALRAAGWRAIAARLAGEGVGREGGDALAALEAAGFVSFQTVGDAGRGVAISSWPGSGARVLVLDGPAGAPIATGFVRDFARALADAKVPTVVAEVYREERDGPDRAATVKPVLDDGALSKAVSTVDDVELVQGRVAAVLALSDLGRGVVGHYGYGSGASRPVPEWSNP